MNEFALMAIVGILSSNVVTGAGYAVISLQSEKRNLLFMLISMAMTIVSTIIAGLLYSVLQLYVLQPLEVEFLGLFIMILFSFVISYASRAIVNFVSKEQFYLYEKSYQFAIQTIVMIAVMLLVDYSGSFLNVMFQISMFCSGFLIVSVLIYPLYERLDNNKAFKPARNIPLLLYTLSILAMIISAITMMI